MQTLKSAAAVTDGYALRSIRVCCHIAQVARILEKLMLLLLPDAPSLKLYHRRSCVIECRWGCSFFAVVGCAALSAATTAAADALMAHR